MKLKHLFAPILALGLCAGITSVQAETIRNRTPATANVFADAPVAKVSWTGVYVGLHGGYGAANGELSFGPATIDGFSATGPAGGIHVGADVQIPGSMLVLGARGGYTWENTEFTITAPGGAFKAGIDRGWNADGRMGLAMGTALPYIFGGYTKVETSASLTGAPAISTPDLKGWRAGGGVEFRLPKVASGPVTPTLALEYIWTDFSDVTLGTGPFAPNLNVTEQVGMVRLNLRFGQ
jgi:outer membrane immunogenic protein